MIQGYLSNRISQELDWHCVFTALLGIWIPGHGFEKIHGPNSCRWERIRSRHGQEVYFATYIWYCPIDWRYWWQAFYGVIPIEFFIATWNPKISSSTKKETSNLQTLVLHELSGFPYAFIPMKYILLTTWSLMTPRLSHYGIVHLKFFSDLDNIPPLSTCGLWDVYSRKCPIALPFFLVRLPPLNTTNRKVTRKLMRSSAFSEYWVPRMKLIGLESQLSPTTNRLSHSGDESG